MIVRVIIVPYVIMVIKSICTIPRDDCKSDNSTIRYYGQSQYVSYLGMVILASQVKWCAFSVVICFVGSSAVLKQDIRDLLKTIKRSKMQGGFPIKTLTVDVNFTIRRWRGILKEKQRNIYRSLNVILKYKYSRNKAHSHWFKHDFLLLRGALYLNLGIADWRF